MTQVAKEGKAIDVVTVTSELVKNDKIEKIGGVSYLSKLADAVPNTATFKHYEQIMIEAHQLREAKKAVQQFLYNPSEEMMDHLLGDLQACRALTMKKAPTTI